MPFFSRRDVDKVLSRLNDVLKYSHRDKVSIDEQFNEVRKQIRIVMEQNRKIMSLSEAAVDRLVEVARGVVVEAREAAEALRKANERTAAVEAELAEFKSTDAAEDAAQLAAQDAQTAQRIDERTAELQSLIDRADSGDDAAPADELISDEDAVAEQEQAADDQLAGDVPAEDPAPASDDQQESAADEQLSSPADGGVASEGALVVEHDENGDPISGPGVVSGGVDEETR